MAITLATRGFFPADFPLLSDGNLPTPFDISLLKGPFSLQSGIEWYWKSKVWTPAGSITASPASYTIGTTRYDYTGGTVTIPSLSSGFDLLYQQLSNRDPWRRLPWKGQLANYQVGMNGSWTGPKGAATVGLNLFNSLYHQIGSPVSGQFVCYQSGSSLKMPIDCLLSASIGSVTRTDTTTGHATLLSDDVPCYFGFTYYDFPTNFPTTPYANITIEIDGISVPGIAWTFYFLGTSLVSPTQFPAISGSLGFTREDY